MQAVQAVLPVPAQVSHDTEKYMPQPWLPEGATKVRG